MIGNVIRCPNCKLDLIDEEVPSHRCQAKPFQWFFEGDWLFGTEKEGWCAINWKEPSNEILHDPDLDSLRRRVDRTRNQEVYIPDNFRKNQLTINTVKHE